MFDEFVQAYKTDSQRENFRRSSLGIKQSPELIQKRSDAMKRAMRAKKERLLLSGKSWFDK